MPLFIINYSGNGEIIDLPIVSQVADPPGLKAGSC